MDMISNTARKYALNRRRQVQVSRGPVYCSALIYDTRTGRYCVAGWGDWIESKERAAPSRGGIRGFV